jgi:hypothetical protein
VPARGLALRHRARPAAGHREQALHLAVQSALLLRELLHLLEQLGHSGRELRCHRRAHGHASAAPPPDAAHRPTRASPARSVHAAPRPPRAWPAPNAVARAASVPATAATRASSDALLVGEPLLRRLHTLLQRRLRARRARPHRCCRRAACCASASCSRAICISSCTERSSASVNSAFHSRHLPPRASAKASAARSIASAPAAARHWPDHCAASLHRLRGIVGLRAHPHRVPRRQVCACACSSRCASCSALERARFAASCCMRRALGDGGCAAATIRDRALLLRQLACPDRPASASALQRRAAQHLGTPLQLFAHPLLLRGQVGNRLARARAIELLRGLTRGD